MLKLDLVLFGGRGVYSTIKYKNALQKLERTGSISGALNPNSKEASIFADKMYAEIRKRTTDYKKIAKNTKFSEKDILEIKNYIFNDKHELTTGLKRFDPDYQMTQSWIRLTKGTNIEKHDITMLKHEKMELQLVKKGLTQAEAHKKAEAKYNYDKEVKEYERNQKYKK